MKRTPRANEISEDALRERMRSVSAGFIAWQVDVTPSEVSQLVAIGMPRSADGSFDWHVIRKWLKAEGRTSLKRLPGAAKGPGTGAAAAVPVGSADDYDTTIKRLKAAAAQREHDIAIGALIQRTDAITAQMRLALEFKAVLLQLPDQLSTALANLSAREVEAILRERVQWILGQAQDGDLPLTPEIVERIAELVADVQAVTA